MSFAHILILILTFLLPLAGEASARTAHAAAAAAGVETPPPAASHFPSDEELTSRIRRVVEDGGATGIVVGILDADGSRRFVSWGDAGPGAKPLGSRSLFEIGSITKTFTATLLADMVVRGEVSLRDPVSKYLPQGVSMPARGGREITLLDLATHYSGLPRLGDNHAPADAQNPYADYTVEKLYAFLSSHQLRRDVGAEYEYSNVGVGLLGHVLARAAGQSWEDLVRTRILEPLGMTMTSISLDGERAEWMTRGHGKDGKPVPYWDAADAIAAAGALRSNAEDMLKFVAANVGPAQSPLERAMRETHRRRKDINATRGIGLAWNVRTVGGRTLIGHGGGTAGYRTFVAFDPDTKVGVVVLGNSGNFELADNIAIALIHPPPKRTEVEVSADVLRQYVGEYRLSPKFSIVVTEEDGALFTQATNQARLRVYPESETRFFLKVVDAQLTFTKNEAGEVTGLILHQNGRDARGEKVKSPK